MGYPVTLNGRTYTLADFSGQNYAAGFPDALEDFVTEAGTKVTAAASSATAAAASETAAAASAAAAAASVDAIEGFYLGAQASNPTVDLNGAAVTVGDFYFNTATNQTRIYDGANWNVIAPDLVGDSSPQLGGNLDVNGNAIVSTSNGNIAITPNGTGEVDISKVDIDGGAIDGTVIGASSAAAGTFTTFTSTGIDDNASGTSVTVSSGGKVTIDPAGSTQGTHELSVREADSPRITIDDINGTDTDVNAALILRTGTTNKGVIGYTGSDDLYVENKTAAGSVILGTNDTDRLTVDSSGHVGIGGDGNAKLEVFGPLASPSLGTYANSAAIIGTTAGGYGMSFSVDGTGAGYIQAQNFTSSAAYGLSLNYAGGTVSVGGAVSGTLQLNGASSGNEGGQLNIVTAGSLGTYSIDAHTDDMRFLNGTSAGNYVWYKNSNAGIGMTLTGAGDLSVNTGSITVGDGTNTASHIAIKPADDTTAEDLQFYNGTTRVGEIGTQDTTWLRINQETSTNIYTPRYIRADGGFFVDGTAKGINGSGNFIGGTVTTPSLTTETASGPAIFIKDTSGTGASNHNSWISYRDSGGTEVGYVGYGSSSNTALSVSNYSNGPVSLHGTAISLSADTTVTGSVTFEGPDGGGVLRTWPGSSTYAMFGTANMTSSEYALLSDGTNTFIAGGAGGYTEIRYANNQTDQRITVGSSGITFQGNIIGAGISSTLSNIAASGDIYVGVNSESYVRFQGSSGTKYARFYLEGDEDFRLSEGGVAHFNSNVIAYSTTIASDAKLKDNVQTLENPLEKVAQLRGVSFTWNDASQRPGTNDIGLIAQEVQQVFPEIVTEAEGLNDRDPHLTVDYARLVSVLVESVKQLSDTCDRLTSEVEALKNGASV